MKPEVVTDFKRRSLSMKVISILILSSIALLNLVFTSVSGAQTSVPISAPDSAPVSATLTAPTAELATEPPTEPPPAAVAPAAPVGIPTALGPAKATEGAPSADEPEPIDAGDEEEEAAQDTEPPPVPKKIAPTVKKPSEPRSGMMGNKDAEGTRALDRGQVRTEAVIKSRYKLNGDQLEVDPD